MGESTAVLVMAYGTPRNLDEVEAYYTDIRHGRPPPPDLLQGLRERYAAIGGSPLLEITRAQAKGIAERTGLRAYVGQKHAAPFIPDAVESMSRDGVERAIGIVLAPHYSKMSIGDYARRAERAAAEKGWRGSLRVVESWHLNEGLIALLAARVTEATARLPEEARRAAVVLFTAHSLPERILQAGDPYPGQLRATAAAVAAAAGIERWDVAWQSAGRTGGPWLGPDLLDVVRRLAAEGTRGVVVCPCGFVSDHLEVLYDVDIEARGAAEEHGVELVRTRSPNADPEFLDVLASVVKEALAEAP